MGIGCIMWGSWQNRWTLRTPGEFILNLTLWIRQLFEPDAIISNKFNFHHKIKHRHTLCILCIILLGISDVDTILQVLYDLDSFETFREQSAYSNTL